MKEGLNTGVFNKLYHLYAGALVLFTVYILSLGFTLLQPVQAQQFKVPEAVQLYSDAELAALIRKNTHLHRVRDIDNCQLYQDIKAQAEIERRPTYQFLYGDMLAYAICYDRDVALGVTYMQEAAAQGLPEALEQLGRYYHVGQLVQPDIQVAIRYLREAASLGNLPAQKRFAEILLAEQGSALDMEAAYHYLHHAVTASPTEHQQIKALLAGLEKKMPPRIVERAKLPLNA